MGERSEKIAKWKEWLHFQHSVFFVGNKRVRIRKRDFKGWKSKRNRYIEGFLLESFYRSVKAENQFQGIARKRESLKRRAIRAKRWELWFKKANQSLTKR